MHIRYTITAIYTCICNSKPQSILLFYSKNGHTQPTTSIHNGSICNPGSVCGAPNSPTQMGDITIGNGDIPDSLCKRLEFSIKNMFDAKLFGNIYVVLLLLVAILMGMTHYSLYTFTPRRAESEGLNPYQMSLVLSMVGLGDIVGRIVGGFMGFKLDNTMLYIMATSWIGALLIICSLVHSFLTLSIFTFILSVGVGEYF